MFRRVFLGCGFVALLAGLAAWCGHRVAIAACSVQCEELTYFTSSVNLGDPNGKNYKMTSVETCKRHWVTDAGKPFVGSTSTTEQYKELEDYICIIVCFKNGETFGKATCTQGNPTGTAMNILCYNECRIIAP